MAKIKVHELAKEIDKSSKEVLNFLQEKGIEAKAAQSSVEETAAEMVRKAFGKKGEPQLTEEKIDHIVKMALIPENDQKLLLKHDFNLQNDDFSQQYRNKVNLFKRNIVNGIGQNVGPQKSGLWLVNGFTTTFQNGIDTPTNSKLTSKFNNLLTGRYYDTLNKVQDLVLAA